MRNVFGGTAICVPLLPLQLGNLFNKVIINGVQSQAVNAEINLIFRYPVGVIISIDFESAAAGGGGRLVADPRLSLAVTGQNKKDMVRDFLVDLFQHRFVKLRSVQANLKHFNLRYGFTRRNIQRGRRQLVPPVHQPNLIDKRTAQRRRNVQLLVKFLLRYSFAELS